MFKGVMSVENGSRLSHAYIVAGAGSAAENKAMELCRAMLCTGQEHRPCGVCRSCRKMEKGVHPDLISISRQSGGRGKSGREIYVEQIRDAAATLAELPNDGERKVYLIRDAGSMNAAAQNALLKMLEEPPAFVSFVLLAESDRQLLDTVRSRCVIINLNGSEAPPDEDILELSGRFAQLLSRGDALELLRFFNGLGDMSGEQAQTFAACCKSVFTDMLCLRRDSGGLGRRQIMELIALMDRADAYLRSNTGVKHVFGMLSVRCVPEALK